MLMQLQHPAVQLLPGLLGTAVPSNVLLLLLPLGEPILCIHRAAAAAAAALENPLPPPLPPKTINLPSCSCKHQQRHRRAPGSPGFGRGTLQYNMLCGCLSKHVICAGWSCWVHHTSGVPLLLLLLPLGMLPLPSPPEPQPTCPLAAA
jgi:hypothetical protein